MIARSLTAFAAAALLVSGAHAATTAAATTAAKPAAAKPTMLQRLTGTTSAKPAAAPAVHHAAAPAPAHAPAGRVVAARTATGKTVHYDCGKAGNANKKACH